MTEARPVDRALEWLVYAPVGATVVIKDMTPGFVTMFATRGRNEIAKGRTSAEQRLKHYRQLGELVIAFGPGEVKRRVGLQFDQVLQSADGTLNRLLGRDEVGGTPVTRVDTRPSTRSAAKRPDPRPTAAPAPAAAPPTRPAPVPVSSNGEVPDAVALAIPDYDGLSASQVVDRLGGLTPKELGSVREYESAHRGRRTILGKIAQLTA